MSQALWGGGGGEGANIDCWDLNAKLGHPTIKNDVYDISMNGRTTLKRSN